jgi:hypothetical protein
VTTTGQHRPQLGGQFVKRCFGLTVEGVAEDFAMFRFGRPAMTCSPQLEALNDVIVNITDEQTSRHGALQC